MTQRKTTPSRDPGSYSPSPYPMSILPRVQHTKPRPSRVQTVDLPPTPAYDENDTPDRSTDDDINEELAARLDDNVNEEEDWKGVFGYSTSIDASHNQFETRNANNQDLANDTNTHLKKEVKVIEKVKVKNTRKDPTTSVSNDPTRSTFKNNFPAPKIQIIEVVNHPQTHNNQTQNLINNDISSSQPQSTNQNKIICDTCMKNVARYTCPKCQAPYCSVSCYRIHDGSASDAADQGSMCTESFYKDRVLGDYQSLGNNEDDAKLRGILARMHRDINEELDHLEQKEDSLSQMLTEDGKDRESNIVLLDGMKSDLKRGNEYTSAAASLSLTNNNNSAVQISDDDLAELAAYILQMEENDIDDSNCEEGGDEHGRNIIDSIPPHLLHAFECALASATGESSGGDEQILSEDAWKPFLENDNIAEENVKSLSTKNEDGCKSKCDTKAIEDEGKVNAQSILNRTQPIWKPWWLPCSEGMSDPEEEILSDTPTLDERIIELPPLPKLCITRNVTPNIYLAYNVLEVLYATSFAMRSTAHYLSPADQRDDIAIDRAALLLSHSSVLSKDARYESVHDALSSCAEKLVEIQKTVPVASKRYQVTWETLASDVATLSHHRRYVLRMLFEASDICQTGMEYTKKQLKIIKSNRLHDSASSRNSEMMKKECEESKQLYRLAFKKVGYLCPGARACGQ